MKNAIHTNNSSRSKSTAGSAGHINLSFSEHKRTSPPRKREALLTFMEHTRKISYRPAPSTLSFLRTVLSLFV